MAQIEGSEPGQSFIILHGGAGPRDPEGWNSVRHASERVIAAAQFALAAGTEGLTAHLDLAERALQAMEDDTIFNAGRGACLQRDGQARLSASLMDGPSQRFSGVVNMLNTQNPSRLVRALQSRSTRVLGAPGHDLLARELGMPIADLLTSERFERYAARRRQSLLSQTDPEDNDTVGVVVHMADGRLAAASSTGGRGYEYPGRISDSCTVAGNYASATAAVTCTGVGEEIIDDALAARLEARVRDGMPLSLASRRTLAEAEARGRAYGWIACAANGDWVVAFTTAAMPFAVLSTDKRILAASIPNH